MRQLGQIFQHCQTPPQSEWPSFSKHAHAFVRSCHLGDSSTLPCGTPQHCKWNSACNKLTKPRRSRSSEHASNVYKMCLDDKLGSAPAPMVAPEVGQLRQPSGNLSDGGVYMCDDTTHAAAATVEVAFSGGEWHVSDPDATEDDDDAMALVRAEGSAATKASFANWAELPDGILREVSNLTRVAEPAPKAQNSAEALGSNITSTDSACSMPACRACASLHPLRVL